MPPLITRVLETALYVDDVAAIVPFYRDVLGLRVLDVSPRLAVMDAGQSTVLLLFRRGSTIAGLETAGGRIPPHDGAGPIHMAFAIAADAFSAWEEHLREHGVEIESMVRWDRGGRSMYFRDPAGHALELATPGTWSVY
jgi:catechol 2,3-dioxygenase-like lactoylglutathione lyase family enzyme